MNALKAKDDLNAWLDGLDRDPAFMQLLKAVHAGGDVQSGGVCGSSPALLAIALSMHQSKTVVLVLPHLDDADETLDELIDMNINVARLPAIELSPGESGINLELVRERLSVLKRLTGADEPRVLAVPVQAMMQLAPDPARLPLLLRTFEPGDKHIQSDLVEWLVDAGYTRVETIESVGEFAVRGGIIDLFAPGGEPVRLDFFGDELESINAIDLNTMGSDRKLDRAVAVPASADGLSLVENEQTVAGLLPDDVVVVLVDLPELMEQARSYFDRVHDDRGIMAPTDALKSIRNHATTLIDMGRIAPNTDAGDSVAPLPVHVLPTFAETVGPAIEELGVLSEGMRTIVACQNDGESQRVSELIQEHAPNAQVSIVQRYLHRGFVYGEEECVAFVPYHELLHRYQPRRRTRHVGAGRTIDAFVDLAPGDLVVHRDHGIARFLRLGTMEASNKKDKSSIEEYLTLEFDGGAKIHVPAGKIDLIQKYVGAFHGQPQLSKIGGRKWASQKEKVAGAVRDLAAEMLRIQAARESMPGVQYPADTTWQHEFEAAFPYVETEDQVTAIASLKRDLSRKRPMDRLVCGDVGFGKTEVAIRGAFKVAEFGRQVAVLVPTTVLAVQHERTMRERFADYPFRIESLSRFKTKKEQTEIVKATARGEVDILVGTHRIVSKDVRFADLGMVIIDEEQRFGVEHKQRLLELRATADVLTMSATPIPRTLHMAMLGLRDISSLTTPPLDRRAIVSEVMTFDKRRIKHAIERELARDGQVYFVHNRVHDIHDVANDLRALVPGARITIGHGQMPSKELESVMLSFVRRQVDILLCTTIIESGIDIPTANTMIIHDAHMFGLSELHQLRGRVGRYKHRAYCYLTIPGDRSVPPNAVKRLRAIESFSMLGAGFKIAMRDLEIRGAGNLLGPEQSGHIAAVGYEMYCQLLEQAVDDLRNNRKVNTIDTTIDLEIAGALPQGYIPSVSRRLDAYRRVSQCGDLDALDQIESDLESAYGPLPRAAQTLVELAGIRVAAAMLGIRTVSRHERDIIFKTAQPTRLEQMMGRAKGTLRMVGQPDAEGLATIYYRPPASYLEGGTLLAVLRRRLRPAPTHETTTAQST